jgi:hypothetical protein
MAGANLVIIPAEGFMDSATPIVTIEHLGEVIAVTLTHRFDSEQTFSTRVLLRSGDRTLSELNAEVHRTFQTLYGPVAARAGVPTIPTPPG